jgi:hypothetical protein
MPTEKSAVLRRNECVGREKILIMLIKHSTMENKIKQYIQWRQNELGWIHLKWLLANSWGNSIW